MQLHVLLTRPRMAVAVFCAGAVSIASGCSSDEQSAFCRAIRRPSQSFASATPAERLGAFDRLVAETQGQDQRDLQALRPYLEILYAPVVSGLPRRTEQQALADIKVALATTFPKLDYRIRRECRVPIEGDATVFGVANKQKASK